MNRLIEDSTERIVRFATKLFSYSQFCVLLPAFGLIRESDCMALSGWSLWHNFTFFLYSMSGKYAQSSIGNIGRRIIRRSSTPWPTVAH